MKIFRICRKRKETYITATQCFEIRSTHRSTALSTSNNISGDTVIGPINFVNMPTTPVIPIIIGTNDDTIKHPWIYILTYNFIQ